MDRLREYYRSITAKFTDKEMDEAMQIGYFTIDRVKPEDGYSQRDCLLIMGRKMSRGRRFEIILF
jgi:hypothetical protein